jgi:16S rRNA (guanine1516-N2)-methyltransferase
MEAHPSLCVCVTSTDSGQIEKARQLSNDLNIPFKDPSYQMSDFKLVYTDSFLELQSASDEKCGKAWRMSIDLIGGSSGYRRKFNSSIKQPLAKAIGVKPNFRPTIVDATAGLGIDSFVIATMGCKVTLIERSSVLAVLLSDALSRAALHDDTRAIVNNMSLKQGDSIMILRELQYQPQTIYLDPMYPHKKKSSLNKKEMRIIRKLVGDDVDAPLLFEEACKKALQRVVVKRPKGAPTIAKKIPTHVIEMKNSRFDVYITSHL